MSKKLNKNRIALTLFALFLIGAYALLFKQSARLAVIKLPSSLTEQSNTYTSEVLDISFLVPEGFEIEEIQPVVYLRSDKGEVSITKNNLDMNDFGLFIEQYDERRNINVLSSIKLKINGYQSYKRVMQFSGIDRIQKSYFIFPDQWVVYTLSTTSPELYDDLEEIVQSFKYLGK